MAEDMGEKTELPSAKKREDARNRGQVAKSQDLSGAIDLLGGVIVIALLGVHVVRACMEGVRRGLDPAFFAQASDDLGQLAREVVVQPFVAMVPMMVIVVVVALVTQIAQVGLHVTGYPITPKLTRLNPVSGAKNMLGGQNLMKTAMGAIKLVVVGSVGWVYVMGALDRVALLPGLSAVGGIVAMGRMALELALWLLAVLVLLGMLDYMYQRYNLTKTLRMTKQEVTDERRNMDGDPETKARRYRMMREIMSQQIGRDVPTADVIVTNPTHYAIALRYDESTMAAPTVVAKGVDILALRIRQVGLSARVPIVERPPLARAIYASSKVGQQVRPEFYQAVAELLAYVYRLDRTARAAREADERLAQEAARAAFASARREEELVRA